MTLRSLLVATTLLATPVFAASPQIAAKAAGIIQIAEMFQALVNVSEIEVSQEQLDAARIKFVDLLAADYTDAQLSELIEKNKTHNISKLMAKSIQLAADLPKHLANAPAAPLALTISDSYKAEIDKKMAQENMRVKFAGLVRPALKNDNPSLSDQELEAVVTKEVDIFASVMYNLFGNTYTESEYKFIRAFEVSPLFEKLMGTYFQALQTV